MRGEAVVRIGAKPERRANCVAVGASASESAYAKRRRRTGLADGGRAAEDEDGLAVVLAATAGLPGRCEAEAAAALRVVEAHGGGGERDGQRGGLLERQVRWDLGTC